MFRRMFLNRCLRLSEGKGNGCFLGEPTLRHPVLPRPAPPGRLLCAGASFFLASKNGETLPISIFLVEGTTKTPSSSSAYSPTMWPMAIFDPIFGSEDRISFFDLRGRRSKIEDERFSDLPVPKIEDWVSSNPKIEEPSPIFHLRSSAQKIVLIEPKTRTYLEQVGSGRRTAGRRGAAGLATRRRRIGSPRRQSSLTPSKASITLVRNDSSGARTYQSKKKH